MAVFLQARATAKTYWARLARVSHQCSAAMHIRTLLLITYEEYLNALYTLRCLETMEACTQKIRPL